MFVPLFNRILLSCRHLATKGISYIATSLDRISLPSLLIILNISPATWYNMMVHIITSGETLKQAAISPVVCGERAIPIPDVGF